MEHETTLLTGIRKFVSYLLVFLFPLFFLPFTQEFFVTNKMYFMFFGALTLLLLSALEFLLTKKLVWKRGQFDGTLVLFFITAVLSVIISSPNKIQAVLQPVFGVGVIFSFLVAYFILSRDKNETAKDIAVYAPGIIVSLTSAFFFFNPLKNANLTGIWSMFKSQYFTPLGNQLDVVYFLGFIAVLAIAQIFSKRTKTQVLPLVALVLSLTGISLTVITLLRTQNSFILPPANLCWFAAVETLNTPANSLFGVGVDNYAAMFTRVKDSLYNASPLWQISSFNVSRSTLLHVLTEMGVFGLAAFGLLMLQFIKKGVDVRKAQGNKLGLLPYGYVVMLVLLFPPSITLLFLIFLLTVGVGSHGKHVAEDEASVFETGKVLPLYASLLVVAVLFIGAGGFLAGKSYASEVYFKNALDALAKQDAKNVYENMRQAVMGNPFIERYRSNFSQVNLLIANNIASKLSPQQGAEGTETAQKPELTEEEKQTISQALQAAIEEAKAVVSLNPQKAANWEGLAAIYRNIINVAQGADSWTVSAYQRAIVLDPQNPVYRVSLGGIMFSFKNYDEAYKLFEQAVSLKPDWPNAHYNLAWAAYQKEDYRTAATAMQNAVSLLDPKNDEADYKRASTELEEFKKKLPADETASKSAESQPSKLSVPSPAPSVQPQIKLPEEASPEAK